MENIIVIKPKTQTYTCFVYGSVSDLENLIRFVGKSPAIGFESGKMVVSYKKTKITEGSVIFRDAVGNVTNVQPIDKVKENYELVSVNVFSDEFVNNVPEQAAPKTPKADKKAKK